VCGSYSNVSRILTNQSYGKGRGDMTYTEPVDVLSRPQMVGIIKVRC
jgi:hypothetical protein